MASKPTPAPQDPAEVQRISEGRLQQNALLWLNRHHRLIEEWFHSIPNGGKRSKREASELKATGLKAGVSDTFLPEPRGRYHGLYVEFKTPEGVLSTQQIRFITCMRAKGYCVVVIDTLEAFQALITDYLALPAGELLPAHHYYRFALA